ncbi:Suf-domain-containing protein [Lentinus brumalis]|uniref:mRNA 3'-end-processing protein RNA14 n=1 Tax=Lentinus brumalis TaxID=2498619 RepID=A0A371CLR8_9APHY|nr:Suf-domain-containing protein [Polyporus brumalis]
MDAVRRAYQQAVQIPMENVKRLWEDYQDFENGLNKITAKKFISDLQESHMQARTVYNQLQDHLSVLFPPSPPPKGKRPAIWLPRPPTFNSGDKTLLARWRQYLKWEESNPLLIEESNKNTFIQRMQSVYKKAIVRMRFYPEIWFMAYSWTSSVGKADEALATLKAGVEANPSSFALNFDLAEVLELQGNFAEVHATYEKFLEVLQKDLEALEAKITASKSSTSIGSQQHQTQSTDAPGTQSQVSSFSTQGSDDRPPKDKELSERRTHYGIAWINYIKFARRAEGLKSARAVFGKARRDRWTPWEVHEAEALMEFHCGNKDVQVASRIFEKGMELFSDEVEYVLRYLGFLISINDENNARALFERVIGTFPADKARPLWERWARYEYQYGDLATAHKLEKRMAEVYPQDPPIKRFAERHKYLNIDAIATRDLGFVLHRSGGSSRLNGNSSSSSSGLLGRTDTLQSIVSEAAKQSTPSQGSSSKRAQSPDHRRRDESRDYPSKRARPGSPSRGRDRDRWESQGHRRHGSPMWDRERERDAAPPPPRRFIKEEKEEDKGVQLPGVLNWFIGTLPAPNTFDGPIFRTDDLMQVFRNAVIPSSSAPRPRSPPPPPRASGGGRPPPDYGPYQGPGSSGRRGRW